jgi:hypothetical protein
MSDVVRARCSVAPAREVRERRVAGGRWSALRCAALPRLLLAGEGRGEGGVGLHDDIGARRVEGGRWSALRCGGRPFGPTALRCSLRRATSTTRSRVRALRHVEVVAAYRSNPAPLRCTAPQRRAAHHPPATLRGRQGAPTEIRPEAPKCFELSWSRTAAPRKAVGGWPGARLVRRRGAQGTGGCRAERAVERSCLSTVACAAGKRASSSLAPGHRAPQSSRRAATTAAPKRTRPPAHGFALSTSFVRPK